MRGRFLTLSFVAALWFVQSLPPDSARARTAPLAAEASKPAPPVAAEPSTAPRSAAGDLSVVLLTLDGVRAKEIFEGPERWRLADVPPEEIPDSDELVPNLRALAFGDGAVVGMPGRGAPMLASGPRFISLPGYLEITTGRPSGCLSNGCPTGHYETIIDQVAALPEVKSGDVALFASWSRLAALDPRHSHKVVVSAGRTQRAREDLIKRHRSVEAAVERGARVRPYPGHGSYRPDRLTASVALAWLGAHPTRFAFISLGDCDEYGHRGDYRGYLGALTQSDHVVGDLIRLLAREHARGRQTLLLVTVDHGRSKGFAFHDRDEASSHVWLVAAGSVLSGHGVIEAEHKHHLSDVAPTIRAVFGLPADTARHAGKPIDELIGTPL